MFTRWHLTAVVAICGVALASVYAAPADAGRKVNPLLAQWEKLETERAGVAEQAVEKTITQYSTGETPFAEVLLAMNSHFEAQDAVTRTAEQQLSASEKQVAMCKRVEEIATKITDAGHGPASHLQLAKAYRLSAEISALRAHVKQE